MSTIDPDLNELLAQLTRGGLAELAYAASYGATEPDEGEDDLDQDDRGGRDIAPPDGQPRRAREEQLRRASEVICSRLKRELEATTNLQRLAEEFHLQSVTVLPRGPVDRGAPIDNLLSARRRQDLNDLLRAWKTAENELRNAWSAQDGA